MKLGLSTVALVPGSVLSRPSALSLRTVAKLPNSVSPALWGKEKPHCVAGASGGMPVGAQRGGTNGRMPDVRLFVGFRVRFRRAQDETHILLDQIVAFFGRRDRF